MQPMRFAGCLAAAIIALLQAGCSPIPFDPNNEPDDDLSSGPIFRGPSDVPGFFSANEPWTLSTTDFFGGNPVLAAGVGDLVEYLIIGSACFANHSRAVVSFDGTEFRLDVDFPSPYLDGPCGLHLAGDASACTPGNVEPGAKCTIPAAAADDIATATIDGDNVLLLAPDLIRLPQCDGTLESLTTRGWAILNVHVIALTVDVTIENLGGVIVSLEGNGSQLGQGAICTDLDENGQCVGCTDSSTSGSVEFSGDSIAIDIDLGGGGESCSFTFSGTVTYCANFDQDLDDGLSGQPLFRIDGNGTYRRGTRTGSVRVLYLGAEGGN